MIDSQPAQEDRTAAILTHLSGIFFGFIVPLIVWLVAKDTKPYLTTEAKEALNFQITIAIAYVAAWVLTLVTFGFGAVLFFVPMIANLVLCIIAAVKTSQGEQYQYPLTLRLIK